MQDQPHYEPLEASDFFADGQAARLPVAGTIARGQLHEDEALFTGKRGDEPVTTFPLAVDRELLDRGRERFTIYCTPCHAASGEGDGMIVRRGFPRPPSYHIQRLRDAPPGHIFDVITRGFGAMPRFADRIEPRDRWAIVAYVQALQLSHNATLEDIPPEERAKLEAQPLQSNRQEASR
jgi:mono/diheme cytochrome c family protein